MTDNKEQTDIMHEDFIRVYEDVYPAGFCKFFIEQVEKNINTNTGHHWRNRQEGEGAPKLQKEDFALNGNVLEYDDFEWFEREERHQAHPKSMFYHGLQNCYEKYIEEFSSLKDVNIHGGHMKIQKTTHGGGYHVWHAEHGPHDFSSRVLVFALYLNDIEGSGETEFIYQAKKIPPKENTIIIWPAAFTHVHRGNPVYGNTPKYIITGWFDYA